MLLPHFDLELWPGHVWNGQWFFSGMGVESGGGVAKDGETIYSQQKQDLKVTVAQIISFSQKNSGLN